MAKKFKAYPWPDRSETIEVEDDEEIDVVGDSPANNNKQTTTSTWGPSSPTAGATAPSPPPHSPKGSTILYNGEFLTFFPSSYLSRSYFWFCNETRNRFLTLLLV